MKALSLNSWIVYIKRDVSQLSVGNGRPLSKDYETLCKMEKEREPYYIKYSDVCIENNHSIENTINKLVEVWNENTGA